MNDLVVKRTRGPNKSPRRPSVYWSENHWLALAKTMIQMYPELGLLDPSQHPELRLLSVRHCIDAQAATFDPAHRRPFAAVSTFKPNLLAALRRFIQDPDLIKQDFPLDDVTTQPPKPRPVLQLEPEHDVAAPSTPNLDFLSGGTLPLNEPVERRGDKYKAIATRMHEAFEKSGRRIVWTREEWIEVARELHLQNPYAKLYNTLLSGVTVEDVRAAQRVLPQDRRRHLRQMMSLREPLLDAMRVVKSEILEGQAEQERQREEAQRTQEDQQAQEAQNKRDDMQIYGYPTAVVAQESPQPPQTAQEAPQAAIPMQDIPTAAPAPVAPPKPVNDDLTLRLAAALKPFVELIAGEVAKHLAPRVEEAVLNMLTMPGAPPLAAAAPVEPQPVEEQQPVEEPQQEHHEEHHMGYEEQPKPPRIGVLCHSSKQKEELQIAFPDTEFVFIDKPATLKSAIDTCDKILGLESHVNQASRELLKKIDRKRYAVLHGGTSTLKRQIQMWFSSGELRHPHQGAIGVM